MSVTIAENVRENIDNNELDKLNQFNDNPGYGGQAFLPGQLEKVRRLRAMIGGRPIRLEVDGGVTAANARACVAAGADVLVAGSSVFGAGRDGYAGAIQALRPSIDI